MGKKRSGNKRSRDEQSGSVPGPRAYNDMTASEKTNDLLQRFYALQELMPTEELDQMFQAFREPLPTTFRVTGSRDTMHETNDCIKDDYVPFLTGVVYEGASIDPPVQIPWFPEGLAWQVNVAKRLIRKSPEFKKFQNFLVYESEVGNISRQEVVSMIPPLFLDIKEHHTILDSCAAPGSKSAQILEALHSAAPDGRPSGVFIANDADLKRCHMLVHQSLRRIGSPNMMVLNNDASTFPTLKRQSASDSSQVETVTFDRILADVPCSGDGTLRKNLGIWKHWNLGLGLGLHPLQFRILSRNIQQLKPGGRLVYSTCSLNPYENEAVVNAALSTFPGMSLVDVSEQLPGLKREPGKTTWKVLDSKLNEVPPPADEAKSVDVDGKKYPRTLWPSTEDRKLERCIRIYPHLQNTGGFFVAVLEKAPAPETAPVAAPVAAASTEVVAAVATTTDDLPSVEEDAPVVKVDEEAETKSESDEGPPKKKTKIEKIVTPGVPDEVGAAKPPKDTFKEEPYNFLSPTDPEVKTCVGFFKINADFDPTNMMVRSQGGTPLRSIYVTSSSVRRIVIPNNYKKIRLVSCGVKCIAKQDSGKNDTYPCKWRVLNDGVSLLRPFMSPDKVVHADIEALKILLEGPYPSLSLFDDAIRQQLERQELGSCLLDVTLGSDASGRPRKNMCLPLWKAPNTLCLMVEKREKSWGASSLISYFVQSSTELWRSDCFQISVLRRGTPTTRGPC